MIPALKAVVAGFTQDRSRLAARAPLIAQSESEQGVLAEALDAIGFAMPGLEAEHV